MRLPFPWFFALCAALLFGLSNPLGKIAVSKMHPLAYATVTSLFAGILALVVLRLVKREIRFPHEDWKRWVGLGLVSLAVPTLLTGYAFSLSSSISVGLLLRMEAFFTVLFGAIIYHETISRRQGVGLAVGLIGAVAFATNLSGNFGLPEIIVILASAFYGTFLVFVKTMSDVGPLELIAARSLIAAVPLGILALPYFSGFEGVPEAMGLSLFSFFLGPLAYAASVNKFGLWKTGAVAQFFSAVFSVLAGVIWLNESFTFIQWTASALILAGGLMVIQNQESNILFKRPRRIIHKY